MHSGLQWIILLVSHKWVSSNKPADIYLLTTSKRSLTEPLSQTQCAGETHKVVITTTHRCYHHHHYCQQRQRDTIS